MENADHKDKGTIHHQERIVCGITENHNYSDNSQTPDGSEFRIEFKTRASLNDWLTVSLKALARGASIDRVRLMEIIHDRLAADPLSIDRPHRDWYCRTLDRWLRHGLPLAPSTSLPDPRARALLLRADLTAWRR